MKIKVKPAQLLAIELEQPNDFFTLVGNSITVNIDVNYEVRDFFMLKYSNYFCNVI